MIDAPATYADVEEREIGKQAKISELADLKIENDIANSERQLGVEEQALGEKSDAAMTEDAMAFIDQMDQIHDEGGDPMEMYDRLPPEMQDRISQLLQGQRGSSEQQDEQQISNNVAQDQLQNQANEQFQPMPQSQGNPQQGNVSITDQAKQIAQL